MMEAASTFQMSVNFYHTTGCNIPEDSHHLDFGCFQSRVLATIGVTRGFGDHDLKALNSNIAIKPFLLSQPEVSNLFINKSSKYLLEFLDIQTL
jgi:hypothetical protein